MTPVTPVVGWVTQHIPAQLGQVGPAAGAGIALLAVSKVIVLASAPFLGLNGSAWRTLAAITVVMVLAILAATRAPWSSWSPEATLAFPFVGLLGFTVLGLRTDSVASAYLGVIPLWFLYVGLFHRLRSGVLLVPVAAATYVAMVDILLPSTFVRLVIYGAVWFAISGILAVTSSQQRLVTRYLEEANHTDPLTGLGNRRGLDPRLAAVVEGDCVVLCDLDLFKSINDAFGHAAGDEVLAQFGRTIDQLLRRRDYAARYGGEEFVLILVRTTPNQAIAALTALRAEWLDVGAGVTFSAGIAEVPARPLPGAVLAAADAALYEAKAAGRDRFHVAAASPIV
ncbi:GGDEF domain-containing protein [Pengzhenrongella sicca]|uniref:GGDEF domain-containing protein n=1 Tax=Pengzhenrongella sicca TaxID=2819238 RepID=A0A8A4Z7I6_9MICO|nr:GGDEF domain-containing protein [Pengzhenrongella sicca]QTE27802.1 GGDEF domain-containing protein [Pengzhenrongella sicca]